MDPLSGDPPSSGDPAVVVLAFAATLSAVTFSPETGAANGPTNLARAGNPNGLTRNRLVGLEKFCVRSNGLKYRACTLNVPRDEAPLRPPPISACCVAFCVAFCCAAAGLTNKPRKIGIEISIEKMQAKVELEALIESPGMMGIIIGIMQIDGYPPFLAVEHS